MARPWHALSTLRRAGCPDSTQDSLPVAGQALPDGIGYPQGSYESFPRCNRYISSPFPRLLGAGCVPFFRPFFRSPGGAGAEPPEGTVNGGAVVAPLAAALPPGREKRRQDIPVGVGKFVSLHKKLERPT